MADGAIERAENRHLLGRERLLTQAHELRLALGRGLHRSDKRHLVLRALPGLAARALAAQVGVGDFDPAVELAIVFTHAHDLHERVLHEPGGLVANPRWRISSRAATLFLDWLSRCMARNRRESPSLVARRSCR